MQHKIIYDLDFRPCINIFNKCILMNNKQKSIQARTWITDSRAYSEDSILAAYAQRLLLGWEFLWQLNLEALALDLHRDQHLWKYKEGKLIFKLTTI